MSEINDVLWKKVIDNREISMVDAFKQVLPLANHIDIAVGYFFLSGFESIEDDVTAFMERGGTIRILMGNITNIATGTTIDEGYASQTKDLLFNELKNIESSEEKLTIVTKLHDWIANGKIEVKVYTGEANYFHAKSFLFYRQDKTKTYDGISIVGSSNFTKSGFLGNTELNSLSQDNFGALTGWYHEIWDGSEVSDFSKELLDFIDKEIPKLNKTIAYMHPEETYLMFARYFAKRLPQEIKGDFMDSLYKHQRIGVAEVKYRLDEFGTAVLADGVGLGKTRTSAAIISATEAKNVLILASKKLQDQWKDELKAVGITADKYRLVSKEEIARYEPAELTNYMDSQLIIIDEAHQGLKNSRTKLYRNLSYMKERSTEKVRGLLLTATPWNNSRSDVFNLGRLFLNTRNVPAESPYFPYLYHSPRKAAKIIVNDDKAFHAFWRDLFLQRTKKTYGGNDVLYAERKFPVSQINYEPQKEKAFLLNGERINRLYLPYMNPIRYAKGENEVEFTADRMKMLFLKRADSSWKAYKDTLENVRRRLRDIQRDLTNIKNGDNEPSNFREWLRNYYELSVRDQYEGLFEDMEMEELTETLKLEQLSLQNKEKHRIRLDAKIQAISAKLAKKMLTAMLKHTEHDLNILGQIIDDLDSAFKRKDEKYEKVRDTVHEYLREGEKVLLISQFRSTVLDYYERFMNDEKLNKYQLAQVSGGSEDWYIGTEHQESKETILEHFSPRSKNKESIIGDPEEIQALIGTETLSIGQNLQDSRVLMNLDLPYNPMNLEQRIGRIDRPREGDERGEIKIVTFPSMPVIESELNLSDRLKNKLEGIYQDTKFDDLVLPEYREFLRRVLKQRDVEQNDMEEMMNETGQSTVVRFEAEEHSEYYVESQKRMREAIEENVEVNKDAEFTTCSFSRTKNHDLVLAIALNDVNGVKIDEYLLHVSLNGSNVLTGLINVEKSWNESKNKPILYTRELKIEDATSKYQSLKKFAENIILTNEIDSYNKRLNIEEEIDNNLIDRKIQKVMVEITDQVRGRNKKTIASKIQSAGYEPKSIQSLINQMKYIDRRYDAEEMEHITELYENIDLLWDNYKFYYEIFTQNGEVEQQEMVARNSVRTADNEKSTIRIVIGNISVLEQS